MKAENLKIRCSSLGLIVPRALLTHFEKGGKQGGFPLTIGMKTEIEKLYHTEKFKFRKNFTNKFVEKGNLAEAGSIADIVKMLGLPVATKNTKRKSNAWIQGELDVDYSAFNFQIDTKNVYYPDGLDTFDDVVDHIYEVQQHGYNWLWKVQFAYVIKILKNPPEQILEKETWILLKQAGLSEMTDEFKEAVRELMDFEGKQPIEERVNFYQIETKPYHIEAIKEGVRLCRKYWEILEIKDQLKNKKEIAKIQDLAKKGMVRLKRN